MTGQTFWDNVSAWFDREVNILLRDHLFGVPSSHPQANLIKVLLLFAKFYIYRQRLFHLFSLSVVQFLRELRLHLQVEKYLMTLDGTQQKFPRWIWVYDTLR